MPSEAHVALRSILNISLPFSPLAALVNSPDGSSTNTDICEWRAYAASSIFASVDLPDPVLPYTPMWYASPAPPSSGSPKCGNHIGSRVSDS